MDSVSPYSTSQRVTVQNRDPKGHDLATGQPFGGLLLDPPLGRPCPLEGPQLLDLMSGRLLAHEDESAISELRGNTGRCLSH